VKIVGNVLSTPSPYFKEYKIFSPGLSSLMTKAKNAGHQAVMFDQNVSDVDPSQLETELREADLLALSCRTASYNEAVKCLNWVKGLGLKIPTVIGGVHATFDREKVLGDGFDFIIVKEGDLAFPMFLEALENRGDFGLVPNLCWKKDGKKIYNPVSSILPDLDRDCPFPDFQDKSLFPQWNKNCKLPIEISRSCPHHCEFCSVHPMFGKYRQRKDLKPVVEYIRKIEPNSIFVIDDCFASYRNTKTSKELAVLELSMLNKIPHLDIQIRADSSRDEEWLNLMKRAANFTWAGIGLETNNPEALKQAEKQQTVESVEKDIEAFKKAGLIDKLFAFLIVGFDSDTEKTASKIVKWAKGLMPDPPQLAILTPFRGTRLWERLEREGRLLPEAYNPELCDCTHVVFKPLNMTADELQESWRKAAGEAAPFWENVYLGLRGFLTWTMDWISDIKNEERLRKHFRSAFLGWVAWKTYRKIKRQNKGYLKEQKRK